MAKPEIGLSMLYSLKNPFKSIIKHLSVVETKHIELPDEGLHTLNKKRINKLKEFAETNDLTYIVHAPWAGINIASPDAVLRRTVLKRLEKSIINAGRLNSRLWVFHPGSKTGLSQFYPGKDWNYNLESIRTLMKISKREGVTIAIENTPEPFPSLMKTVKDFQQFYEELDEQIGMVLDVAHANLNNQIREFINHFSQRIVHIHVSDNNGTSDQHLGIGYGNINWKNFAELLKEIDYSKLIILESTEHIEESLLFLKIALELIF